MCNHIAVAKVFVMAACTLAIALFTTGMGVNSTWAGSDPSTRVRTAAMSPGCYEQYVRQCRQGHWQDCVVEHRKVTCEYYCQWQAHHYCNR
jgi:hypothetical protein